MKTVAESDQTRKRAIGIVVGSRTVRPVAGSRMIDLTFQDPDPNRAQQIVMALADGFIASNIDKRFQANAFAKTFLEEQLAQLKIKLEAAEKAMIDFAEREKIVVVTERASIAENNLTTANAALSTLVQERVKNEELWKQVETTSGMNLPQFLSNTSIETMRAKRSALVTDYQQKLETYKPSFPAMVQITNQIKDLDRQLATEVVAIKASLKAAYESSRSQEQETRKHVDEYKAELLDLQKRSVQYNLLKREADTTRALYDSLLQRYKEVDVASGVGANNVFIVDKAEVPGAPVSPNIPQALFMAIALGLGLGLGSAYLLEYTDDAVRSAAAVEQILGLPVLGIIPKPAPRTTIEEELAEVRSAVSESYRSLATALMLSTERGLPKSLIITSSGPAEGKSSTAVALARHYASVGLKVLLVDADMRKPSLHKKLGTDNGIGFSTYLTGACSPPEAFKATSIDNLAFMSSGPLPPNAADLLSGQRLMSLLSVGGEIFDCIILDGPPTLGMADAQLLANAGAATLLIVSAGETKAGLLTGALKRLRLARGRVIGAVLTKYDARSTGYEYGYGYGYSSRYSYGYGERGRELDQKQQGALEDQSRTSS